MKMNNYGFGVDIGGTRIKMGFFRANGDLIDKWELETDTRENGEHILSDVAKAIDNRLAQESISKEQVCGIGIGVPGPVTADGIVNGCVNLGWGRKNVAEELSRLTALKVKVANDANLATLGEMWKGAAQGTTDAIMITLGTGVGAGVIVAGQIVAGFHGSGGEIGHIIVNEDEIEPCNCGQYGCLEQYSSATGIVRMAKRKLAKSAEPSTLRSLDNLTAKDVFEQAKCGDELALEVVEENCKTLGATLSNIACVTNPEIILIGGGVSKAGDILLNTVKKYFIETAFRPCKDTRFELATLGNDAGIYGAMKIAIDS